MWVICFDFKLPVKCTLGFLGPNILCQAAALPHRWPCMLPIRLFASRCTPLFAGRLFRCFTASADADEFCYPVMLIGSNSSNFIWESNDITEFCDLDPAKFNAEKKIVYSSPSIKILRTTHKVHGTIGFSFIKDHQNLWKISTITKIGRECPSAIHHDVGCLIINACGGSLTHVTKPYQYISPPNCWSMYDAISAQIKDHEDGDKFALTELPKIILASRFIVQTSCVIDLMDSTGKLKSSFEAVATMNDLPNIGNQKLCSILLHKA